MLCPFYEATKELLKFSVRHFRAVDLVKPRLEAHGRPGREHGQVYSEIGGAHFHCKGVLLRLHLPPHCDEFPNSHFGSSEVVCSSVLLKLNALALKLYFFPDIVVEMGISG